MFSGNWTGDRSKKKAYKMKPNTVSAGSIPAQINPHEQLLNAPHAVETCGQCGNLDRNRVTRDGYKWCSKFMRYTRPDHVGC